jgi:multicomponent K+:H+ antiporter subunit D
VALGLASTLAARRARRGLLLGMADTPQVRIYRLGDWPALFGIVLVLDRLSALMLALVAVLGLAAFVSSLARWDRAGPHFHPLFQFQLMGLNGAFLTGDLFNLFVFFEVMLAASYGLALHGSGTARVRAGLHYIVVNLVASLLFLIGVSVVYGISGTLNMADLAARMRDVAAADRALLEAGLARDGHRLPGQGGGLAARLLAAGHLRGGRAPAAAILSILSKVGVYAVLRVWLLLFGEEAGASAGFGGRCCWPAAC